MSTFNLDWAVDTSQIDKLVNQLQAAKDKAEAAAKSLDGVTAGVKRTTAATHEFSLANAGTVRELSVMFGEAMRGNWSRLEGSMTVLARTSGLLKMAFTPLGAVIGVSVAAMGALAIGAAKGAEEQHKLATALVMTGNAAGSSAAALTDAAQDAGRASANFSGARDAVDKLTESGRFSESQIRQFGTTVASMSRTTGESVEKLTQKFIELGDRPVEESLKLNKTYHYLTEAVMENIAALEREGRTQEAGAAAQNAFNDAMAQRDKQIRENLSVWQKLARETTLVFGGMWNSILNLGREDSLDTQVERARAQVKSLTESNHANNPMTQQRLAAAQANLTALEAQLHDQQRFNQRTADKTATHDAAVGAIAGVEKWQESTRGIEAYNRELAKYRKNLDDIRRDNPNSGLLDPAAVKRGEDEIRRRTMGGADKHAASIDYHTQLQAEQERLNLDVEMNREHQEQLRIQFEQGKLNEEEYIRQRGELQRQLVQQEMTHTQVMIDIAKKHGQEGKVEAAKMEGQYKVYAEHIKTINSQVEADLQAHTKKVQDALSNELRAAEAFNAQRKAALDKGTRQMFMTPNEKADADAQEQIQLHYNQLMEKARLEFEQGKISAIQYTDAIAQLNEKLIEAKKTEQGAIQDRIAKQGDWTNGAKLAFKDFVEQAQDTASQTKQLFTDAFSGLNNALVGFVKTGKLNFGDLTSKVIEDLILMEIKAQEVAIFKSIMSAAGNSSTLSTIASFFGFASGGVFGNGVPSMHALGDVVSGPRFFAGGSGLMGEAGPEAIMPLKRGADGRLGVAAQGSAAPVSGPMSFDMSVTINGNASKESIAQLQQMQVQQRNTIQQLVRAEIQNQQRTRGLLGR
jgi:lambda family phage tail tape measure protein